MTNQKVPKKIVDDLKSMTESMAVKMASEAKLASQKLHEHIQEKQDAENKRLAIQYQHAQQQQLEINKNNARKLAATALNQMPRSKQLFGEVSAYSLHVEALTDQRMIVCLSSNHIQEEKNGNFRSFCRTFQETVFNLHMQALSNLQYRIDEDREIMRGKILDALNRFDATSPTPQYDFQRYLTAEQNMARNRYLSLYNQHLPFLHYVGNVSVSLLTDFELSFEIKFEDGGLHPSNYLWHLNQ